MTVVVSRKRGPMRPDSRNVVRGEKTRRRILESARARILAEGFEALRLDDLAEDAGVTKAAVIRSVGGKASILLTLSEEDRQTRVALIREAINLRSGLRRRLADLVRRALEQDATRLNAVMAHLGYLWFWTGADHRRAQAMLDDTRSLLCELVAAASPTKLSPERQRIIALRIMSGYVIGLRDLHYGRATLPEAARFVVDYSLD